MASYFLTAGILGACSLSWVASGANVSCGEVGKAYNDPNVSLPQEYVADEAACQAACAGDPTCKVFTYYTNKQACWKLTDKAVAFELTNATLAGFAISGPKSCNETAGVSGTVDSTTVTSGDVSVVTDSESSSVSVNESSTAVSKGVDESTPASKSAPEKGGIPMWVWLIGAAVLLICCGGAGMYLLSDGDEKSGGKSKKKKAESTKRGAVIEAAQAAAPAPAGLPAMAPVPTISQCLQVQQPQYVMQQPAQQYYLIPPQAQAQMYAPVQQGYEYELSSQASWQPGAVQQMQMQAPAQPTYIMPQGYEQV